MREESDTQDRPRPCPVCSYDLRGTLSGGGRICPECAFQLSERDVVALYTPPNADGEPARMKPGEVRIPGRLLLLVGLTFILLLMIVLLFGLRTAMVN